MKEFYLKGREVIFINCILRAGSYAKQCMRMYISASNSHNNLQSRCCLSYTRSLVSGLMLGSSLPVVADQSGSGA